MGASAHADTGGDFAVTVGSAVRALHDGSANALTGDSLVGGGIGVAYRLPIAPLPSLALFVEGGWTDESVDGTMFQTLATEITLQELTLGVQARYAAYRHVVVYARGDLGTARDALTIRAMSGAQHAESDAHWGGVASGAVGVELLAYDRAASRWDLGLRVELGYAKASGVALAPEPGHPDDDTIRLPMSEAGIGKLDLSGPTFSAGLVGHF